jgi:hypothetical protein
LKGVVKKSERILVVIPVPGTFENISCLEYAIEACQSGAQVYLLDLSRVYSGIKDLLWRIRVRLTHKNILPKVVNGIASEFNITNVKFKRSQSSEPNSGTNPHQDKEIKETFANALRSKFSTVIGKPIIELSEISSKALRREKKRFFFSYYVTSNLIDSLGIERVVTWNGRFVVDSAVALASTHKNIEVNLLEVINGLRNEFEIYNKSPHSISSRMHCQDFAWQKRGKTYSQLAQLELERKFLGRAPEGVNFTRNFKTEFKISDLTKKPLIAFFPGTSFENKALGYIDSYSTFNGSEVQAFTALAEVAHSLGFAVLVRVHPRGNESLEVARYEDELWEKTCKEFSDVFVIHSESDIDSYSVLKKSDLNVVYQSSIAIESIVLGRSTMILGDSDYSYAVPELCAFSKEEIRNKLSLPFPKVGVERLYPWAYWQCSGGYEVKDLERKSDGRLFYRDLALFEPLAPYRVLKKFLKGIV